jgi:hypothetical protein
MFEELMKHFEREAPVSVMARVALEGAITSQWVDEVFAAHRQRQYPRELLFSTVVELMTLVSLGLSPSLYAAATKAEHLPVSLAALYDKVNRTEPAILRALVQGSAQRLEPVITTWPYAPSLPGWRLRVLDGNHLAPSEKRLAALREPRGGIRRYAQRDRGEPLAVPAHDRDIVGPCAPAKAIDMACSPLPTRIVAPRVPDCMRFQPAGAG